MDIQENMVAIITGGASGLGEATARKLSKAGIAVAIFDLDSEAGIRVAEEIEGMFVKVNVADPESVANGLALVLEQADRPRIVVNCAGIAPAMKTISKEGPHDIGLFKRVIDVNLIGTVNIASQAAVAMSKMDPLNGDGERGVIINTASVAAFDGQIGQIAYSASKAAISGMTLPMARDLARDGIRVMTIAPGIFKTPMLLDMPDEVKEALGVQVPFPSRLGDPGEYASLVMAIVENSMLNGETIRLDGAIRMAPR